MQKNACLVKFVLPISLSCIQKTRLITEMKDKTIRDLLRQPHIKKMTSIIATEAMIPLGGPAVHAAKYLQENDCIPANGKLRVLLPAPYKTVTSDEFAWFGLIGTLLNIELSIEVVAFGVTERKEIATPYTSIVSKLSPVKMTCLSDEDEIEGEFDIMIGCHPKLDKGLITRLATASYKHGIWLSWSETDWLITKSLMSSNGMSMTDPIPSDYELTSKTEKGSGFCRFTSNISKSSAVSTPSEKSRADFLLAMSEHSAMTGYTNPMANPGTQIKEMVLSDKHVHDKYYVIDNLFVDQRSGLLYSFKDREIHTLVDACELKKPFYFDTLEDRLEWGYVVKIVLHLRNTDPENAKLLMNTVYRYSSHAPKEYKHLLAATYYEYINDINKVLVELDCAKEFTPALAWYHQGCILQDQDKTGLSQTALQCFLTSMRHGSVAGAFNAYMGLSNKNTRPDLVTNIDEFEQIAHKGFDPLKEALAEGFYQLNQINKTISLLFDVAGNGNINAAHNLMTIGDELNNKGEINEFEYQRIRKLYKRQVKINKERSNRQRGKAKRT